tara:strand:+ start:2582 stop:3277 length:696 start_codon:yes stop_codon:yes gene_type:complete
VITNINTKYEDIKLIVSNTVSELLIIKSPHGYQLQDKVNDMSFILNLDEYDRIIKQNKTHTFNKIFKKENLKILDCTGGFARDAAIMSSLGNQVTLIEQESLIMALLVEAKQRIKNSFIDSLFKNIVTKHGNCLDYIRTTNKTYDYLYFDFMFNISKSALPTKREQFLRKIVPNSIYNNKKIIMETLQRVSCKIIIKEHVKSNDYEDLNIINTYKEKTVKYHLLDGKNGYK